MSYFLRSMPFEFLRITFLRFRYNPSFLGSEFSGCRVLAFDFGFEVSGDSA